jgi:sarcosine dehydrogenase
VKSSVPNSADVVIIGGGVIGCSTLYHLAKSGITNVVLLERDHLTSGTTWHTAGLVWSLRPNDLEVELLHTSQQLMKNLDNETGVNPGWINNGGLFIASSKERLDEYQRLVTLGKAFRIESYILSPESTAALYPLMNVKDIYGTLYSPADGTVDPAGYCSALTRAARRRGAKLIQKCSVNGIETYTDEFGAKKIRSVITDKGTIRTGTVVNCAGVWAPSIGQMAGVKVPLVAMKHAYVVTQRIEGIQNMPNVRDHDASVYLKLQGDALCVGGYEPNPIFWDDVKKDFAFSLFDLDWDVFGVSINGAVNRVPVLEKVGIKSTVCGPEAFTADHKPLMGESPEVRGFYLGCGFNSSGMMMSGGAGAELAKWIIDGRPELDMFSYDIRRFSQKLTSNVKWIKERSHESYAKNYSIVFPYDEPLAGRNLRKDALHGVLLEAGCVYQERHGWERPGWFQPNESAPVLPYDFYGSYGNKCNEPNVYYDRLKMDYTFNFPQHHNIIKAECLGCRQNAAIFNMSYFGKFYLTGPDAQAAANWIFTNDVNLQPGSTIYTCMLNKRGGVEGDLTVSAMEPGDGNICNPNFEGKGFYLAIGGTLIEHGFGHIMNIIQDKRFNCQLVDVSDDMAMISIQGPKSRDILQSVISTDLSDTAFPFSTHKTVSVAGHMARAVRLSFVGELGWELHVPNQSAEAVYKAVWQAGQKHGLVNAGYRAIDSLSLEKGYRHWHADLRSDDTPLEAGLGFTCKLKTNVPFVGREAVENQKADGHFKKFACFTINENLPLHGLEAIYRDNRIIGFTRRANFGYSINKSIAVGYLRRRTGQPITQEFLRSGKYVIEHMGRMVSAEIHLKSPFDPENLRVKGIYK